MRHILAFSLLLSSLLSISQRGDFLITEHFPDASNIDNTNFEIISDHQGLLCIANRSGVLKYDGSAWDYFKTPSAALSLAVDSSHVVYVGCIGSVGMIDFDERSVRYKSLIESDTISDLFLETHFMNNKVYFLGNKHLLIYDILTEELTTKTGSFSNIYEKDFEMFVNTPSGDTYLIADSLQKVVTEKSVAYSSTKKGMNDLIIDFEGTIYEYENYEYKRLPQNNLIKDGGFAIQEIQWINDTLFTCSTFESGVLIFDKNKADYMEVLDYHSGLPDNEIYTLHADKDQGVWAAHQFGISRISPLFPAYSFSNFPGLEGNLTGISQEKNELWISTSLGLFYFNQDTLFKNKVYYEVVSTSPKKKKTSIKKKEEIKETEDANKPFLKRLFNKKNRADDTEQKEKKGLFKSIAKGVSDIFDGSDKVDKVKGKLDKNTKYVRRVRKIPVKVKYHFDRIEGTDGKFNTLIPYQDKLLATSISGVYEITKKGSENIISANVRAALKNSKDQLLVSTADLDLKIYQLQENVWIEQVDYHFDDIIVNMSEDKNGNVWMAGSNKIYKTQSTDSSFSILKTYSLNNKYLDNVNILTKADTLYFINSQGYFFYDNASDSVIENFAMENRIGKPLHHIYDPQENVIWVFTGKIWNKLTSSGEIIPYEYLGLFPDLRNISLDKNSNKYWLLTKENEILKYDPKRSNQIGNFDVFLKVVSNQNGIIDHTDKKFSLSYDENFLNIELSKPDFLGLLNPEFQYKLEGLNTEWSQWTRSKSIDFSFLPEGKYSLLVRSRDTFGRLDENEMLEFTVHPPYWQTPWFYALQIMFFGGLVLFSSRMNQNKSQNRIISGALTVLTLVLIIEFLQSAIASLFDFPSSPVIDFALDVFVALLIFPLEHLLRNLMMKGKVNVNMNLKEKFKSSSKESTTE
ncbi:MAG: triple tyrosine motif-containing protein [Ekhidna sp.]